MWPHAESVGVLHVGTRSLRNWILFFFYEIQFVVGWLSIVDAEMGGGIDESRIGIKAVRRYDAGVTRNIELIPDGGDAPAMNNDGGVFNRRIGIGGSGYARNRDRRLETILRDGFARKGSNNGQHCDE